MCIAMTIVIVWRLRDEEELLFRNLPGYSEYREKVRYRLLPLVW
jgi:protein-S-isoprenylcysteine O-methyltransferase Ste14